MSGYYYPTHVTPGEEEQEVDWNQSYQPSTAQSNPGYQPNTAQQPTIPMMGSQQFYRDPHQFYQSPQPQYEQQYHQQIGYQPQMASWMPTPPTVPSNYAYAQQNVTSFPQLSDPITYSPDLATAGPSRTSAPGGYLSPGGIVKPRVSRSASFESNGSSAQSFTQSDASRSVSPNASEMSKWGHRNENGSWSCSYPGCSSRSTFTRGCDLRKHYKRHTKSLFCRVEGCPQQTQGGFSSKKDRARHEAKHNPGVKCEWEGCDRLFSRVDNMKDHVRRVHKRKAAQ